MKNKICPKCGSSIKWDGLGWTCPKCGFQFEPTPEEVREAVMEQSPLCCKRLEKKKKEHWDLVYQIMLILRAENGS